MAITVFLVLFVFFILGVPIAISLGLASLVGILAIGHIPVTIVAQRLYAGANSFPLMAVPLFLLAGNLMDYGGISKRLVNFAGSLVGKLSGGLAIAAIIASMFFAGISGAAVADAMAIGVILIPAMFSRGYRKPYVVAMQSAASSIGVIIPPSIPMVIYGVAASVSIGRLFLGGFIPGIMMGGALIIFTLLNARKYKWPKGEPTSVKKIAVATKDAIWALLMPVIILGGIIFGVFTPTEAAAVACVYGLLVGMFVYKELKIKDFKKIFLDSAVGTSTVMFVIASANVFAWALTTFQIPQAISGFILANVHSKFVFMMIVNVLLLFVGTFLDSGAAIVILAPVLLPIVLSLGIDPVYFGVVMVVNLAIGMMTPPYGVTLFACTGIAKMPVEETFKDLVPILGVMLLVLIIITYFPATITFLPNLLMK